ncbi:MAG TPA: lysophospholipid acyltransferase family protein [Candidatus Dormibacteraeota bacterium]|nr:lysophospholipid acyltransferase family protein [Candidatus Dormibacteraeota bacterium]
MTYAFLRGVMRLLVHTVLAGIFTLVGVERVPKQGAVLVCCNHASTLEPPLVPAFLPRNDSWSMAKAEYFEGGGFKPWIFTAFHAFPVVRHTADRAALKRATTVLRQGAVLVLYPEGTRITSGGLHRAEPGAGFIAALSRAVVVPAAVTGGRDVFGKGFKVPHRAPLRLEFGQPFKIPPRRTNGRKVEHQDAADAIMLSVAEMLPPDLRGVYSDLDAWRARVGDLMVRA